MLAFLRAMVRVESVSLGTTGTNTDGPPPAQRRTLVHFSSFDGSSTRPPIDRDIQSSSHQQQSIVAMIAAQEQIQALPPTAVNSIRALRQFLTDRLDDAMLTECAAAVADDYPARRVKALADLYVKDLTILEGRLQKLKLPAHFVSPLQNEQVIVKEATAGEFDPLLVERRLAELLGQGIRFRLRMFFNRAPPRLTPKDVAYEVRSLNYSNVGKLVALNMIDGVAVSLAVGDECLSALISNALCRLYEVFGLESMLNGSELHLPTAFCASPASQRQLSTRSKSVIEPITTDECDAVLRDIREATGVLAAARAARFLNDLWTTPGVQEEIQRMGGWSEVESYATVSWKYDLWKLCPADAHLVALCNVEYLRRRVDTYCTALEGTVAGCEAALAVVHKNYHLGTKNGSVRGKYPQIAELSRVYAEALQRARAFPLVRPADNEQV